MPDILTKLFALKGKTALVTGGGGAIGRVLANGLVSAGARVIIHDLQPERLSESKAYIEAEGGTVETIMADIGDPASAKALVDEATEKLGGLDILVNSIGINRRKRIEAVTPDDFDAIIDVNLKAVYFLSQAARPHLQKRGGGKILHISSLSAKYAFNTISVYAASKAAVSQLAKAQAREWAQDNIQINVIEPGFVKTEFTRPLWDDPYREGWFRNFIPQGRLMTPDELVGAALLLVSPGSSYITGQSIVVDGGVLSGATWENPT